jgi:hypothetical protein
MEGSQTMLALYDLEGAEGGRREQDFVHSLIVRVDVSQHGTVLEEC